MLLLDNGTSYALLGLQLPPDCTFVGSINWGSIGYSVAALLGTLTAAPDRRHLLFLGDGSFQLTAQELSTILRHDHKPVIFLINNGGYTIERGYLGRTEQYRHRDLGLRGSTEGAPPGHHGAVVRRQDSRGPGGGPQRAQRHADLHRGGHGSLRRSCRGHDQQRHWRGHRLRASRPAAPRQRTAQAGLTFQRRETAEASSSAGVTGRA
ncbi:hypothetical protein K1Y78_24380 [Streptomyces sp. tea 10]|nr:hypothetical protein [Streptomyces sp. tea 10]